MAAKAFADQGRPVWNPPGGVLLGKAYAKAAWIINPASFPYYASNRGQLKAVTTASYAAILQRVDVVRPVPGLQWKEHDLISRFDHGCPTSTYLQVRTDRYPTYSL